MESMKSILLRSTMLLSVIVVAALLGRCSESEDTTDDLLLGYLAGGGGAKPAFHVNKGGTNQNVGAADTVTYNTVVYDTASSFNTTTSRYVIPSAGLYYFSAMSEYTTGEDARYCWTYIIHDNGSTIKAYYSPNNNMGGTIACGALATVIIQAAAGDTVYVQSGNNMTTPVVKGDDDTTWFEGYKVQ